MNAKYQVNQRVRLLCPKGMEGLLATIVGVDTSGAVSKDYPYYSLKLDVPYLKVYPTVGLRSFVDCGRTEHEIELV